MIIAVGTGEPSYYVLVLHLARRAEANEFTGTRRVLRLQNQLYRLSSVRNDLHIAEFFEPIFAEFNANP